MAKLNITWPQFAACNDNSTKAFEDMCRRLFTAKFLKSQKLPHANFNNAGIEVLPVLEPIREDGQSQKLISFQCKYVDQPSYAYSEFQCSARTTAKQYKGKLDLVYLFCNKTLTTTAKAYQTIVKIHSDAGIETVPISNDEVLDLVAEYPDIAEYFFQARIVADATELQPKLINGVPVYIVTEISATPSDTKQDENVKLLKELVDERLMKCREHCLALELDALSGEIEKLLSLGVNNGELYYYQLLLLMHAGKDYTAALEKCESEYRNEAEWLIGFYASPAALPSKEYKSHTPIAQLFAIDKLFVSGRWAELIDLFESINDEIDSAIRPQLELRYGLSLLNLQENEKAKDVLHALYKKTNEEYVLFYEICSEIRVENSVYQSGMSGHHDLLAALVERLDCLKSLKQYYHQELFVAAIRMESFYHLGVTDKEYLERAIEEYKTYSKPTQENTLIQYYYALVLELNGNRDRAIEIYSLIDWENDSAIAERYMISLVLAEKSDKALEVYSRLKQKTVRSEAVYLFALDSIGDERYEEELKNAMGVYGDSLSDASQIAYFVDSEKPSREIVISILKKLISKETINELLLHQKVELITFLAHCREIILMETALDAIDDISSINSFAIGEVYKALFDIANREYSRKDGKAENTRVLETVDRIADRFLARNTMRKYFLQIKVLCAGAKKMPFSSLRFSKELFEITRDAEIARNIVALLFDRRETNPTDYSPYLEVLERSENPDHCLVTACAMLLLGRDDMADYFAYKALFFLNGEDNYNVYRSYFGFCSYNMHRFQEDSAIRLVRGGVVVTLAENDASEQGGHFTICLDPESDFADETNRSMGIEHIAAKNPDYIKLCGSALGQVVRFRGKKYQIARIMSRSQYGLGFVFRKIQENPELFHGVAWMISAEDTDELIKQIGNISDNSEQIQSLLKSYHFEQNDIGLPIDAIALGDYSRYVFALKYLLYQKDEAFYAGQPVYEDETGQKYVPGLATLVLLAVLGRMDVLDAINNKIIIPESYVAFFQDQYSKAVEMGRVSPGTLYFVDGRPVIQETDKAVLIIWENILTFCKSCTSKRITDQERIDFKIIDGLTGEKLISDLHISTIHLDALLLSKREKATFLCDDLFFRKVATWMRVRNINSVSLIQHYADENYMVPIIKELSKTNYIYVPLCARNDSEFEEILGNLLDGKRKERFYGEIIQRFYEVRDHVLREFFGDEMIDRLYAEQVDSDNKQIDSE